MKYLPFRIILVCMLLPPVLYVVSLICLENHLEEKYKSKIENIYLGSPQSLLNGSIRLKDAVNKNIDLYLKQKAVTSIGVDPDVTVITKQGILLYPAYVEPESSLLAPDPMKVAADNYKMMNEGLSLNVDVTLEHNTLLPNLILGFYIFGSLLVLSFYYRSGINKTKREDHERKDEMDRLVELERGYKNKLKNLEENKKKLSLEFSGIKASLEKEKRKAGRTEDGMLEEIVGLEEKINKNIELQSERQQEIEQLNEKIAQYEKQKSLKQQNKTSSNVRKRFNTLYKNIIMSKRALNGYIDLAEDLKIKSEEIIHQLNDDPELVPVKRKVFGKKNRETVLEVLFAYKGRLYYRKTKDNRVEILVIGTKNTQVKDLEFLDKL